MSAEKPLVTFYIYTVRVSGKFHSLSEEAGHILGITIDGAVAVIARIIKHSTGTLIVKFPVSDKTWILSIHCTKEHRGEYQNETEQMN